MQGPKVPTFRPTVWPAEPPEVPPVTLYDFEARQAWRLRVIDQNRERLEVVLPPDFALQELLEVPDEDGALLEFWRTWGLPVGWSDGLIEVADARARIRTMQSLARHVLAYRDGDEDGERAAWAYWEPETLGAARLWFQQFLNEGLRAFPVHVRLGPDDDAALTRPVPNLYDAVALQLARYLNSDQPITRCSNERCGRPFTVQRSLRRRYENSHHAAGVRYCSRHCAKAQSERDRRARRRQEKSE